MVAYPMFYRRCQNCYKYLPYSQSKAFPMPPRGLCMLIPAWHQGGEPFADHRWGWDVCKDFREKAAQNGE